MSEMERPKFSTVDMQYAMNQNKSLMVRIKELEDSISLRDQQIERLREALTNSMLAIDDWLHSYASEFCSKKSVKETVDRIYGKGILAYIADVQAINRKVLESTEPKGEM